MTGTAPPPIDTGTIPRIETERLLLRGPKASDWKTYCAFRTGPRSVTLGGPFTKAQAFTNFCELTGHWAYRGYGRWILADRETDAALGVSGLYYPMDWPEPEIAWTVFDGAEGQGYAFEAAQASRAYAYDTLGWTTAISLVDPANTRSMALALRMGCSEDGTHRLEGHGDLVIWRHPDPQTLLKGRAVD